MNYQKLMNIGLISQVLSLLLMSSLSFPAAAHHSFAMYDRETTRTLTGKLTRFVPGANHAQLIFQLLDSDGESMISENGEPVLWGVETGSARRIAGEGITVKSFPLGTILTVTLNPLRDGRNFGARINNAPLIKCGMTLPEGGCTEETGEIFQGVEDNGRASYQGSASSR
jgi:hypothetical protein